MKCKNIEHVYDLHGVYLEDLDMLYDKFVYKALSEEKGHIRLITGSGVLQQRIIELSESVYGYKYFIPMHNPGEIIVYVD